jgi:hypothetical protein
MVGIGGRFACICYFDNRDSCRGAKNDFTFLDGKGEGSPDQCHRYKARPGLS